MKKRNHPRGDTYKFILMALLKEGPLDFKGLEERLTIFLNQFMILGYSIVPSKFWLDEDSRHRRRDRKPKKDFDVGIECEDLIKKNKIILNKDNKYELSEKGKEEAIEITKHIEKSASRLEKNLLHPTAAARNTIVIDLFLAIMKLVAGFLSGSVGLIADGADAAIDTASAAVVWIGIKFKKEFLGTLIIILMMFITAVSVGYESINKVAQFITGIVSPITMPYLVIVVEGIALICAVLLFFYQRFVGKRNGSLALISQSIDSKNHIYVAGTIIVGAIFSIFGIHFIDALIGAFIAIRIFIDGIELSKEAISSIRGEETDFSKYEIPLEKHWHLGKVESFKIWILYSIKKDNLTSKEEIINSLEETYKPQYIPILSEFKFNLGEGFDFEEKFNDLITPLLDKKLLVKEDNKFIITKAGKDRVDKVFKSMRFHQNE
ncbi:MAG: cation diffusion facilitator family transporter [Candidatus Caldatribacteriota bacterium]|nr:cation diffusion facilitator family transporter [Candidatus Caldatribacteriota bacterium]